MKTLFFATLIGIAFLATSLHATPEVKSPSNTEVININEASVDQLCTLPGIGRKKAEAIVALRERKPLTRVTQLLRVRGIGPRTVARLKPLVQVLPPPQPLGTAKPDNPDP